MQGAWIFMLVFFSVCRETLAVFYDKYLFGTTLTNKIYLQPDAGDWIDGDLKEPTIVSLDVGSSLHKYTGCSYHKQRGYLIINDVEVGSITVVGKDSGTVKSTIAYLGTSRSVSNLAVDWLSGNVYWTDGAFNWVGMQKLPDTFAKFSLENHFKIVADTGFDHPVGLATDPLQWYLFWSDIGDTPKIERSDLEGNTRFIIRYSGLVKPWSLVTDMQTRRLYWTDTAKGTIESCDYQGNNHKIVVADSNSNFVGLTYYKSNLVASNHKDKSLKVYSTSTGTMLKHIEVNGTFSLGSICMVAAENQPSSSGVCTASTCAHICLRTHTGTKCVCEDGFTLENDGKNCKADTSTMQRHILFTNGPQICAYPITYVTSHPYYKVSPDCNIGGLKTGPDITRLTLDFDAGEIFFSTSDSIYRQLFSEATAMQLYSSTDITGLDYDWINKDLYWCEGGTIYKWTIPSDRQKKIDSSSRQVALRSFVSSRAVTVDPIGNKLYWLSGTTRSKIESCDRADYSNRKTVLQTNVAAVQWLTYNRHLDRLYWTGTGQMGSVKSDGSDISITNLPSSQTYRGIVGYKDFVFWIAEDGSKSTVKVEQKMDTEEVYRFVFTLTENTTVNDLTIYDRSLQPNSKVPCIYDNGVCSQICLQDAQGLRCKCKLGYTLQSDYKSCKTNIIASDYFLVVDRVRDSIYQINRKTGDIGAVEILESNKPLAVAVDSRNNLVYWFDVASKSLKVKGLSSTNERTLTQTELKSENSIAVDHSTGNVYLMKTDSIAIVSPEGTTLKSSIVTGLTQPQSLNLHPKSGKMYWIERGQNPTIKQANMDGSQVSVLVSSDIKSPTDIAVDDKENALYWSDEEMDKIEKIDLNNKQRTTVLSNTGHKPTAVEATADLLYYIDSSQRSIIQINKQGGESKVVFSSTDVGRLTSLNAHKSNPEVHALCSVDNGCCSQLCLARGQERTCICTDGTSVLNNDGKTCSRDSYCPKTINNVKDLGQCLRCTGQVHAGSKCEITCADGYKVINNTIHCNAAGTWIQDVNKICQRIVCPLSIDNGRFAAPCVGHGSVSCDVTCSEGFLPSVTSAVCGLDGKWDKTVSCNEEGDSSSSQLGIYIGAAVGGVVVLIIIITIITCVLIRNVKKSNVNSHNPPTLHLDALSRQYGVSQNTKEEEVYSELDETSIGDLAVGGATEGAVGGAVGGAMDYYRHPTVKSPSNESLRSERYSKFPFETDVDYLTLKNAEVHSESGYSGFDNQSYRSDNPYTRSINHNFPEIDRKRNTYLDMDEFARGKDDHSEDYLHVTSEK